jgi:predicted AlkP superfamily pyrophosphatase or phosphodiesterase
MKNIKDRASRNNSPSGRRVLIVGADGLRPDQVTPETMPTYCEVIKKGTLFKSFYSTYPSLTRVCMATLTTGCYPGQHGLMGNLMYAPLFSEDGLLQTGDHQQIMQFQARTGEPLLLCPNLGDRLAKSNMRLTVSAGSSPGASLIWNFHHPQLVVNPATDYNIPDLSSLHAIRGPLPTESDTWIKKKERTLWAVRTLIEIQLPDPQNTCMVLWMPEPDETQHYFGVGSHQTKQAQKLVDQCLSEVMAAVCRLGLEDELDVLLVSDHGHSTAHMVGSLADYIQQARKELKKKLNFIAVDSFIYGDEHNEELAVLAQWLSAQTWCGMLLAKDSIHRRLNNSVSLSAVIGKVTHERAPLLAVVPAWIDELNEDGIQGSVHYFSKTSQKSYHGSLRNDDMRPFCMGFGPSFKKNYVSDIPAGIVDIAPTVCHLLGMSKESGFSGRVLFEGMKDCEERAANHENVRYTECYGNSGYSKGIRVAEVNETSYIVDCFCENMEKSL